MTNSDYATLLQKSRRWIESAVAERWLSPEALARFDALERATPDDLFRGANARPLVVALFGGTGVGKSSLLNRLAGAPIARVGVERPTSREVTLYAHESVELAEWPAALASQSRVQRHAIANRRDVLWIDSPDIDSTEEANRRLALAWLPHVDLVIYVISPERYRDDVGWRVLQQRGQRHGWMFVLNRWDEGDPRQIDDLAANLRRAGFENPLLFRTSCRPNPVKGDQFEQIEDTLRTLLSEHGVREFERLGWSARIASIRDGLRRELQTLGDSSAWERRRANWRLRWEHLAETIREGLIWPIQAAAGRLATRDRGAIATLISTVRGDSKSTAPQPPSIGDEQHSEIASMTRSLWDDWAVSRLHEFADAAETEMLREGACANRASEELRKKSDTAADLVMARVQQNLRAALAQPGTRVQRFLGRVASFLSVLLPGLALLWVAFRVVQAFYEAGDTRAYLDTNFAVHSLFLVLVTWLIPFGIGGWLKPSLADAARAGMMQGLAQGLNELGRQFDLTVETLAGECAAVRSAGEQVDAELARFDRAPRSVIGGPTVDRAMMKKTNQPA